MRNRYADAVDWIDQALNLPGAAAHPALRVRALCTKSRCLWQMGRGAEQPTIVAETEAIARRLGDPVILSQALRQRVHHEINAERLDAADASPTRPFAGRERPTTRGRSPRPPTERRSRRRASPNSASGSTRPPRCSATPGTSTNSQNLLSGASYAALCLGGDRDATDFAARATSIEHVLDNRFARMMNRGNVGLAALLTGETDAAAHAFREELTLCRDMVVRPVMFEGLRGLAAVAVVHGDDQRAATLVGAADAHRYDVPEDPVEARLDETFFAPARTRWGTDAWNAATREGSVLSFEEAIAYALEEAATVGPR